MKKRDSVHWKKVESDNLGDLGGNGKHKVAEH